MTSGNQSKPTNRNIANDNKKRKHRFLPTYKPVKKGLYPLRPGVQGFFITCDGGRERQASHEAINVIDSFYEELVHGKVSSVNVKPLQDKPINKKTKFTYSDSNSDDDDNADENDQKDKQEDRDKSVKDADDAVNEKSSTNGNTNSHEEVESGGTDKEDLTSQKIQEVEGEEPLAKKQCTKENKLEEIQEVEGEGPLAKKQCTKENALEEIQKVAGEEPLAKKQCMKENALEDGNIISNKLEEKSIDKLIEEELQELGDRSKRHFSYLDSGCNGVVFVQMRKIDADPSPADIVQHMMMSLASTRKHMSRFLLRVLPIEMTCYASEDEITRAIKPVVAKHFPLESHGGQKFAVLYEARANTGIDRTKIINAVAKCVPAPHKVDLNNPDKNIVVQIVKTVCLIGVIKKYKELAKFNVRQLTAPKA